jgi:hypothetical protein
VLDSQLLYYFKPNLSPAICAFSYFSDGVLYFLLWLASDHDPLAFVLQVVGITEVSH